MLKDEKLVKNRITEVKQQIVLIDEKIQKEMGRGFFKRRMEVCRFLYHEKNIQQALLSELKWIANEV